MAVLLEHATETSPLHVSEVWKYVAEKFPLQGDELRKVSGDRESGFVQWRFASNELDRAGWIKRDESRSGNWYPTDEGRLALESFTDPLAFVRELRAQYKAWSDARDEERQTLLTTTILPLSPEQEHIREAAALFVENGFQAGESVFAPGRVVWTSDCVAELVGVFVEEPDFQGASFVEKLKGQLANVSDNARLLMAELVCLQLLPISTLGASAKRKRVTDVLATMDRPVQIPDTIVKAFDGASFNPGTAMSTGIYDALVIIIRVVEAWVALSADEQEATLTDPLALRDFIYSAPGSSFPTQRNSLAYLIRPDFFGPLVSENHRLQIRDAFLGEIEESTGDVDLDLNRITLALQVKSGGPIHFYDEEYEQQWRRSEALPTLPDDDDVDSPVAIVTEGFPAATAEMAASLHMDVEWLQDTLDLIERRKQVIFYGPPGTGKTYLARALAKHITNSDAAVTLVQFHPSYSYEDFFEGYRPTTVDGSLSYELKSGPLKRIAEAARRDPERNFVLIIDEINRGNLAKIFGELYFLLEYRDAEVALLYSQEADFTLPTNITILGTMNTSDRSIALMDAAMRRRFAFVELHPQKKPTASILRRWLAANNLDSEPADLLDALNAHIDSDFAVGPSYMMSDDRDVSERRLTDIWRYEILPLLEEHHYGDGIDIERRYGLPALRSRIRSATLGSSAVSDDVGD